jgi:hypothetical protein
VCAPQRDPFGSDLGSLLLVIRNLGRWFAHFKLGAHLLDLRGLLFELRGESLYLFL